MEEEKEDDKPKTKKVEKTVWDWELINDIKPIWTRKWVRLEVMRDDDRSVELSHVQRWEK